MRVENVLWRCLSRVASLSYVLGQHGGLNMYEYSTACSHHSGRQRTLGKEQRECRVITGMSQGCQESGKNLLRTLIIWVSNI